MDPHAVPPRFEHFLLTRFSVRFTAEQPSQPREWLEYRLAFFRELAYESVTHQVGAPPFRWLVFLDAQREPWFEAAIDELAEGVFEPVWIERPFFEEVREQVTQRATGPYVITTRFDSDDAIARDYIARIQAEFEPAEKLFLNFQNGLQVDRRGRLFSFQHPSNAFVSLIEEREPEELLATTFITAHGAVNAFADVREVKAPPTWLCVVHGANLLNAIHRSALPVRPQELARYFDVEVPLQEVGALRFFGWRVAAAGRMLQKALGQPARAFVVVRNMLSRGGRTSARSDTGGLNRYLD
jgi:hypothetical protein